MTDQELLGLVAETDVVNLNENYDRWLCPICKSKMIDGEQRRYKTDIDDAFFPEKEDEYFPDRKTYLCSNNRCYANVMDIVWNYVGKPFNSISEIDDWCINKNNAPFGSVARQINVEVNKKGVKEDIWLHPALGLWLYLPVIQFKYVSNTDGEILSKKIKLKFIRRKFTFL